MEFFEFTIVLMKSAVAKQIVAYRTALVETLNESYRENQHTRANVSIYNMSMNFQNCTRISSLQNK